MKVDRSASTLIRYASPELVKGANELLLFLDSENAFLAPLPRYRKESQTFKVITIPEGFRVRESNEAVVTYLMMKRYVDALGFITKFGKTRVKYLRTRARVKS